MDTPLSAAQVGEFSRQGFLILKDPLVLAPEVDWCRKVLMGLFEKNKGHNDGRNFDLLDRTGGTGESSPQILKPSYYASELLKFSFRKTGLAIAKQLIGESAEFAGDTAIYKPVAKGGPTPWHQDEAFREPQFDYQEISIWIALTDTLRENGPMAYIPGSHQLGILPHRLQGNAAEANSIECYEGFDPKAAVVAPVPAGAMIIHHCRTVHGATGNKTSSERLAYIMSYSTPVVLRKDAREFPWLKNLRTTVLERRKTTLRRGGFVPEILRLLANDRIATRNAVTNFFLRRFERLRRLFSR